jgi:ABC-type spermidine/putrescine transport system permease subunit II
LIDSKAGQRTEAGWTPSADLRSGPPDPRVRRWAPVDRQNLATPWPLSGPSADVLVDRRRWNTAALISPLLALLCAPVGLCVGLIAAGQIGLGRQRGIAFATAGIVIGSLVPVVVCVWTAFS